MLRNGREPQQPNVDKSLYATAQFLGSNLQLVSLDALVGDISRGLLRSLPQYRKASLKRLRRGQPPLRLHGCVVQQRQEKLRVVEQHESQLRVEVDHVLGLHLESVVVLRGVRLWLLKEKSDQLRQGRGLQKGQERQSVVRWRHIAGIRALQLFSIHLSALRPHPS
eukprot:scaffold1596_cov302-Pinguiococcus_pyrenoidosus.AAC.47